MSLPYANASDDGSTRFVMWAGACGTKVVVYADSFEDAFEVLVEWLDDHAPGCLTSFEASAYEEEAERRGIEWNPADPDDGVVQAVEVNHTVIGHTTLKHGTHIASYEWGGDEVPAEESWFRHIEAKDGERIAALLAHAWAAYFDDITEVCRCLVMLEGASALKLTGYVNPDDYGPPVHSPDYADLDCGDLRDQAHEYLATVAPFQFVLTVGRKGQS